MKKVLIIAYDFPPTRTGGVYRTVKFAKYLPAFGWQPIILTVKNYPREFMDETLLDQLQPETLIKRAYSWEPIRLEKALFKKLFAKTSQPDASSGVSDPEKRKSRTMLLSLIRKYLLSPLSWLTRSFIYIPDEKIGWLPMALYKGLKTIRREKIDLIFSTSPPETNHIVALFLKLITGKPWVADFRDPWTDNSLRPDFPRVRIKYENWLERTVVRRADVIVHVGDGLARMAREKFADVPPEKHHIITNGFDEADFEGLDAGEIFERNKTTYLDLVNIGTIYERSAFEYFLRGFEKALASGKIGNNVRITFVGDVIPMWRQVLARQPFKDHVDLLGLKSHGETIRLMMAADVLLLISFAADERTRDKIITGKIFELIRTGRPVFMIGWKGECSEIVEKSGLGKYVPCDDVDMISKNIIDYYEKKVNGELGRTTPHWDYINRFERKDLTGALVKLFELARKKDP